MFKMEKSLRWCALLVALATLSGGVLASNGGNLVLSSVSRELDLTTPLVKQKVTMVVENRGSSAVTQFLFSIDSSLTSKVSYLGAKVSSD